MNENRLVDRWPLYNAILVAIVRLIALGASLRLHMPIARRSGELSGY